MTSFPSLPLAVNHMRIKYSGRNCRIIVIADKLQTQYLAFIKSHDNRDTFRTENLNKSKV